MNAKRLKTIGCLLVLLAAPMARAQKPLSVFDDDAMATPFAGAESFAGAGLADCESCDADAAAFDQWESIVPDRDEVTWDDPRLKPFDWVRHMGFRHSSTHGRHIGRGLPMEGTSWLNRPYHVDCFSGTLIGDDLIAGRVAQDNELFGGLRIGWDFDYYWGLEARFGWADPNIQINDTALADPDLADTVQPARDGGYFVSDVDLKYYPWGDSKVRPYLLLGAGMARVDFVDDNAKRYNTTLVTVPLGGGVQFRQKNWLAWRLEVLDNLSFGADGVDTLHNISLTAGMELRFGSRPQSYWPWQSSRHIW